ncbi:MAG TPA: beta-(1-6) glucans synthase [Xanthobacteraceae bacterium]|nr:beta-(1-6) glucans synthase [Xanthobacteraceae bacterium]
MKVLAGLVVASVLAIAAAWWWLGKPVDMPASPLAAGERLYCVSYAPFRDNQNPLDPSTHVSAEQIDEDLSRLAKVTDCVRTYSIDNGLDQIPAIARRHGLKVLQGLWLSSHAEKNELQIATTVRLAKAYPDVIRAVVVGNEVLLRGELSAVDLGNIMRRVKAEVPVPITYADVWEFWLRNRDLATIADFITIHILPYWEDFPIPARTAAAHVDAIYRKVAAAFPGREILIGEVGWPSAGRMREGALPSPSNQARVMHEVLAQAKRENRHVNLIEAFDQPWKRRLEGTVGGHWGLLFADSRAPKFTWGQPVSDHPAWAWQALAGMVLTFGVFAVAWGSANGRGLAKVAPPLWAGVVANAVVPGILVGWAFENVPIESLGPGGWLKSLAMAGLAIAAPLLGTAALLRRIPLPTFAAVLARRAEQPRDRLTIATGWVLLAVTVLVIQTALGLVFDPRYKDFPFAPLTAAVVPFVALAFLGERSSGRRQTAETMVAVVLALSTLYVVLNEGFANWQSLWLCAVQLVLALSLAGSRDARS